MSSVCKKIIAVLFCLPAKLMTVTNQQPVMTVTAMWQRSFSFFFSFGIIHINLFYTTRLKFNSDWYRSCSDAINLSGGWVQFTHLRFAVSVTTYRIIIAPRTIPTMKTRNQCWVSTNWWHNKECICLKEWNRWFHVFHLQRPNFFWCFLWCPNM